ncbi:putative cysteine-rich receptor-like protein kinase 35 [Raphanus sativus]|nr:putative cysteine-rich receptor-like protein kinase 35 [Raphanus sativus]
MDLEPNQAELFTLDVTGDLVEYNRTWEGLMARTISAASSTTPGSLAGYIMQQQGGSIRRPVCFFRFDPYPYLDAFNDVTSSPPPQISQDPQEFQPSTSPPPPDDKTISTGVIVAIVISTVVFVALLALGLFFLKRRQSYKTLKLETNDDITSPHSLQIDFKTIEAATDKFSRNNKVGQGGFGEVYKGILPNGTEVAVKRLSRNSGQGTQEFMNEVVLVAKLQHRNLVRLLRFCVEGDEHILVYEFVSNKSLDYFLFDPIKRRQLDWTTRYNIIGGIARGILYLHQDSRLTIMHRDLKASNILLDGDMNQKIADFGMARIFGMEQTRANTSKIAGTFGYMAPEYAMHGQFSMKSDVYSFGVLILEIISGKINSSFNQTDGSAGNLVTHAWRLWRKGSTLELVDSAFGESYQRNEVTRCIHIALLCVQEDPGHRPTVSKIILLLTSSTLTLQVPHAPGFFFQSSRDQDLKTEDSDSFGKPISCSINDVSITEFGPR